MGHRNPWRLAVDAKTGTLFWGDVGPDARLFDAKRGPSGFDEINRTDKAGNFGWPFVIGHNKPYVAHDFAEGTPGEKADVKVGPDGCLYVIKFGTGWEHNEDSQIVRLEWHSLED